MTEFDNAHFDTLAIHAGQEFDPTTGAVIPPIYQVSTFVSDGIAGWRGGYEYSRAANPTRSALQTQLAALEGGIGALSFASGIAAEDALLRSVLVPGDHVVIGNDVYGGTHRLIRLVLGKWGIRHTTVDTSDLFAVEAALESGTKVLWIETPSNPTMKISDIAALSVAAHKVGALVVVDNTFASPALQLPLALGADVVVHSTTKYLGGHSDVLGGAVIFGSNAQEAFEKVSFTQFAAGAVSGPFDAFLTTRGIKTLSVRMQRHCENAGAIARHLVGNPALSALYYPGLETHPGHDIASRQMGGGFGGMLSFEFKGGAEAAKKFAVSTKLFQLAESLGGVESLVCYPTAMTHVSVKGTEAEVSEALVRLSVGIENVDDLIDDIDGAFRAL